MSARVYLLLDIMEDKAAHALQVLQNKTGVVADRLEGHPNFMVIIEAADRERLVGLMMPILDSLDSITKDVHMLVRRENELVPHFLGAGAAHTYQKQSVN